jgi:hypothetical protein
MKLNQTIFAIVGRNGNILGNGAYPALYGYEPDAAEIESVANFSGEPSRLVEVTIRQNPKAGDTCAACGQGIYQCEACGGMGCDQCDRGVLQHSDEFHRMNYERALRNAKGNET